MTRTQTRKEGNAKAASRCRDGDKAAPRTPRRPPRGRRQPPDGQRLGKRATLARPHMLRGRVHRPPSPSPRRDAEGYMRTSRDAPATSQHDAQGSQHGHPEQPTPDDATAAGRHPRNSASDATPPDAQPPPPARRATPVQQTDAPAPRRTARESQQDPRGSTQRDAEGYRRTPRDAHSTPHSADEGGRHGHPQQPTPEHDGDRAGLEPASRAERRSYEARSCERTCELSGPAKCMHERFGESTLGGV